MTSTTLNEVSFIPLARSKSQKFALRKLDFVGFVFGLIAISPMWLVLAVPNFGVSLIYKYKTAQVTVALVAYELINFALGAVALKGMMPKGGAK